MVHFCHTLCLEMYRTQVPKVSSLGKIKNIGNEKSRGCFFKDRDLQIKNTRPNKTHRNFGWFQPASRVFFQHLGHVFPLYRFAWISAQPALTPRWRNLGGCLLLRLLQEQNQESKQLEVRLPVIEGEKMAGPPTLTPCLLTIGFPLYGLELGFINDGFPSQRAGY